MVYYTISDLVNRLNKTPCSKESGWVQYDRKWIINIIKMDYAQKNEEDKLFNKVGIYSDDIPVVFEVKDSTGKVFPYTEEAEKYSKSIKSIDKGGRKQILMNEAYFLNCYYFIENKFFSKQNRKFKKDTRKQIHNKIQNSVISNDCIRLGKDIEELLIGFIQQQNKYIYDMEEIRNVQYIRLRNCLNFYRNNYVKKHIEIPEKLIDIIVKRIKKIEDNINLLSFNDIDKFVYNDTQLLFDKNLSPEMRINCIVDRIYSRELAVINQCKKIDNSFVKEMEKSYVVHSKAVYLAKKLIRSNKENLNNKLLLDIVNNI